MQRTGAFKERGALNKLLTLTAKERARGVAAASAGNHAQGLAYHAGLHGIHALICMPLTTPLTKVSATKSYGADVILHGANYDEAYEEAVRRAEKHHLTFVHAFDDDAVIAGQGTIGLEILQQHPDIEAIVAPIGGGGLIGGIACAVKETNPKIRVFGVQPSKLPSMQVAIAEGKPVTLSPAVTTLRMALRYAALATVRFRLYRNMLTKSLLSMMRKSPTRFCCFWSGRKCLPKALGLPRLPRC